MDNGVPGVLPIVSGSTIGIIANPMSGRDIRRLVAQASVFPNAEKTNMVLRVIGAAGAVGVERVLMSTDGMGVAGGVLRAGEKRRPGSPRWPDLRFVELDSLSGTAEDTRALTRRMRAEGADVLVLLGGDGTVRAAAAACGDVPILPLSTGTNNAFPEMWESTVAGTAAGLLATGRVGPERATRRAKALRVDAGTASEIALVDVCVSTVAHVGSRALWQPDTLRELYCAFAEPHAIGLSSIAGLLLPCARTDPDGVLVRMAGPGEPARHVVHAPIAPGVIAPIAVAEVTPLRSGVPHRLESGRGTVAVDGEREIELAPGTEATVTLSPAGPRVVDVRAALAAAADGHLLVAPHLPNRPDEMLEEVR